MTIDRKQKSETIPPPSKSAHPRAAVAGSASPAAVGRRYKLAALMALVGRVDPSLVERFTMRVSDQELVKWGERAATRRIVVDGARIFGEALDFVRVATAAQRAKMPAVTDQFLAAAVNAVAAAQTAQRALDASRKTATTTRKTSAAEAERRVAAARATRDLVYENVVTYLAGDDAAQASFDEAWGTGDTSEDLASSIEAMVTSGRGAVRDAAARGLAIDLTEAFFADALAVAAAAREAGEDADAVPSREGLTQAAVDRLDGIALWFVRRAMRLFEAAHKVDPSVPELRVISLRVVLGSSRGWTNAANEPPPPPDAPVPPTA